MSYRYYKGFKHQKWPLNSLKVIGNHAIRWAIYDFQLVFHCNYNVFPILQCFWDIAYFRDRDHAHSRDNNYNPNAKLSEILVKIGPLVSELPSLENQPLKKLKK